MLDEFVPADEEHLLSLRGLPVCVVMNDGARHYGLLTGCAHGKVVLNGELDEDLSELAPSRARKRRSVAAHSRRTGKRSRSKAGIKSENKTVGAESSGAASDGWGTLELAPPVAGPRVILPLDPIEAGLVM